MAASRTPACPKSLAAPTSCKPTRHGGPAGPPPPPTPLPRRPPARRLQQHLQQQQQQQQQRYFGRMASNVTDHLKKIVPSHSFHPALRPLPAPSFHRKASSISDYIERQVRPPPRPRRPYTAPHIYFGRRSSNVTDHLRYIPPSHLGMHAQFKSLPYYGRLATSVTDPSKYDEAGDSGYGDGVDSVFCHWSSGSRPSSARLPVAPQHVSKEVLFQALSARGDRPCSARHPTNIGSLLRFEFAHLLDADAHADNQKTELFNASSNKSAPVRSKRSSASAGAVCPPQDEFSHGRRICSQNPTPRNSASERPGTAPATENCTAKRIREINSNTPSQQHFFTPRMAAAPTATRAQQTRPSSARSSAAGERHRKEQRRNMGASTPRGEVQGENGGERNQADREEENKARKTGDKMEVEEEEEGRSAEMSRKDDQVQENGGEQMRVGSGGAQQWEDSSSGVSEGASEKLELVRKWVEQEEQRPIKPAIAASWPRKTLNPPKPADHSRRATSITKFNIWT